VFDFYQKRKLKIALTSPITRGVIFLIVIFIGWSAFQRFLIAKDMGERRNQAEAEVARLRDQKASLEAEVRYLEDERGIEAEMRRQFDVALEGEQVVVIVEKEPTEIISTTSSYNQADRRWYEFWR
jgi:cell division protein FtsB